MISISSLNRRGVSRLLNGPPTTGPFANGPRVRFVYGWSSYADSLRRWELALPRGSVTLRPLAPFEGTSFASILRRLVRRGGCR